MAIPVNTIMLDSSSSNSGGQTLDAQSTPNAPPLDVLFNLLANQRCRYTLRCLCESETPIALADLAGDVASWEQETPLPDIPAEEVKQVSMTLRHTHLPKLREANIVEYTQEQDLVTLATERDSVEPFLRLATAKD